jgi:RNA polymerase sigma-70 factor (ECF subfamily)
MLATAAVGTTTYQRIRPYLFSVAYRMTGSAADAEDLVQDAWIRYLDAGSPNVDSLRAYLTTTVSRLALDYLKSARVRREQYVGPWVPEPVLTSEAIPGPAEAAEQREAVSQAFLLLLEQLSPEQRVVYVLRHGFGLSHDDIAAHVGKTAANCRQILRRAQARIDAAQFASVSVGEAHSQVVERFLQAYESGDIASVAAMLTDDVTWVGDGGGKRLATQRPVVGVDRVARGLMGNRQKYAQRRGFHYHLADLNGAIGVVVMVEGNVDIVWQFDVRDGRIAAVRSIRNPDKLRHLATSLGTGVTPLDDREQRLMQHPR